MLTITGVKRQKRSAVERGKVSMRRIRCVPGGVSKIAPVLAILIASLVIIGMGRAPAEPSNLVTIETQNGIAHIFNVEIADTQRTRAKGLMFRKEMASDAGMLFLFPQQKMLSFWMKDTPLPLDIIFVDRKGRVVHIARDTKPFSLRPISSELPALGALEVNAGTSDALAINVGDMMRHPYFRNVAEDLGGKTGTDP